MGGLNSGPGPGITLLIAVVLVLAQTASSAPLYEEDEGQESNSQSLTESHGCYYNFQHYNEGERILTNEPCLNCTCRNRMLMCYLRVCPFTKGIGQNCTVEKVPGQCCPIITCPEVPVQLLTSTTTEGVRAPGGHHGTKGTEVGHLDTNGCNIDGIFYPNGAQVPGSPEKPCELCYCIRNKTACIMQECALHVDGCRPVYEEGQCFPVRYQCDDSPYEEEFTTTIRPAPTPGLIITTTSMEPLDCTYNNEVYEDGSRIQTEDPCEHCYCLKGKIACAVQECGAPLEKEGQNCTALPPAPGKCCPDSYQCDVTMTSQGLDNDGQSTTEAGIPSAADAGHPTDGFHPDEGIRITEKPSQTVSPLDHITETVTPSKVAGEQKPIKTKPQQLDKETQNESIESNAPGFHPMKPVSTSDDNQKITYPVDSNEGTKRPGIVITPEVGRPETTHFKENEGYDPATDDQSISTSNEKKRPHPESVSHVLGVPTKRPDTVKPVDHSEGTIVEPSDLFGIQPTYSHTQTPHNATTNNVLTLKPQISASDAKDPLLNKLHNIIQDVQAQVSDGKTTETPDQGVYQTTMESQTGHFTDRPEILSHLPQFGSQTSSSGLVEIGSTANGTAPEYSSDIINKLQGIIQDVYSHVTDSIIPTRTPDSNVMPGETQSNTLVGHSGFIRPEDAPQTESSIPEKEKFKPYKGGKYPVKPTEMHEPHDNKTTGEPEVQDKHPSKQTTEKSEPEMYDTEHSLTIGTVDEIKGTQYPDLSERPQDSKHSTEMSPGAEYGTEHAEGIIQTGLTGDSSSKHPGTTHKGTIKLPLRPKPESSYDEPYGAKYPEMTNDVEEEGLSTVLPHVTDRPELSKYPQESNNYSEKLKPEGANYPGDGGSTKRPFNKDNYPEGQKPDQEFSGITSQEYPEDGGSTKRPFNKDNYPEGQKPDQEFSGITSSSQNQNHYPAGFLPSEKHPELYSEGQRPTVQYPEEFKPSSQYPEPVETTEQNLEEISSSEQYPDKTKPAGFVDAISGTEYPESITAKPGSDPKYPASIHPPGESLEEFISGQSNQIKPTGIYTGENKTLEQHPENVKLSGQYPEKSNPMGTEGFKPVFQQFPEGSRPIGQHPDEVISSGQNLVTHKPAGQYPEELQPGLKPGQQNLEESQPTEHYPEETNPESSTTASFQNSYSEDVTGKPDDKNKYPENVDFVPSGQYPEKTKPTDQFSNVSKQPTKTKPTESESIPFEYSQGVTKTPSNDNKYPESSKYPDKAGQAGPETSNSETPFGTKLSESSTVISKPVNMSKNPEGFQPMDEHSFPKKPTGSKPYSTEYPEESGITDLPDSFTRDSEILSPGRPGTTDEPEYSTKYFQKNKPKPSLYGNQHDENIGFMEPSETSTKHFEREKFKPEVQSKYPEKYRPGEKPFESHPEDSKHPEITEITNRPEDQTNYAQSFTPTTLHPESYKPDEHPEGSKDPLNKNKPHSSTESEDVATENPNETGIYSRPKPESDTKPSGIQYQEITSRPDISNDTGVTNAGITLDKYPEKAKPAETLYEPEHQEEGTLKPDDGSKYSEDVKPMGEYPDGSKFPVTEKPEHSKRPYGSQRPETIGDTNKPEKESKYPEKFKPTDENPEKPKPDFEDEPYESEYPEKTDKPGFSYPGSTYKYSDKSSTTQKTDFSGYPDDSKLMHQYPEDSKTSSVQEQSKYPHKPGVENKPYGTESPDLTERPDGQFTEHSDHNSVTKKPGHDTAHYGFVNQGEISKKPADENSYQEKEKDKDEFSTEESGIPDGTHESTEEGTTSGSPQVHNNYPHKFGTEIPNVTDQPYEGSKPATSQRPVASGKLPQNKPENELYGIKHTEKPKVPVPSDAENKPHGTEYDEGITVKPVDSSKYPGENKEQDKSPQEPDFEHLDEDSVGQPDKENLEKNMTTKPHVTDAYLEEIYVSQYPEKVKPPSESQLLETEAKPESLGKYPEKTKPIPEPVETDKFESGTEYPEKSKPNSGAIIHPSSSIKPDISGHPVHPEKPTDTYESPEGITKSPHNTTKYPQKPSDRPSDSEYSEEMGKPQYTEESEHPEKMKPGKPEPGHLPYSTEYPERTTPDEAVHTFHTKEIVTDKPQDLNKYPGAFLDKPKDQIKYPTMSDFEEEIFGTSDKPEDMPKFPDRLKHPVKTKPGTEHLEADVTKRPFDVKVPEGGIGKPDKEHPDQEPEEHIPTDSGTAFETTYRPDEESKNPQMPVEGTFGTLYPDLDTATGKPEDSNKYAVGQKHPQGTEYPELPGKPEYDSKYQGGLPQTGQYTQRPYGSQSFPESEYPSNKVTGRPEQYTKYPEGNEVEHHSELTERPQYFTNRPEGEILHDLESVQGTESPTGIPEYLTKYPVTSESTEIHPEADGISQQPNKYLGSSTQNPEETTDRIDDYNKNPETVTGFQDHTKYPESDSSFNVKNPELGLTETSEDLTKHPEDLKPEGLYPGQPQVSEENVDHNTEYLNIGEADKPDTSTNHSEKDKTYATNYPTNFGITHEQSPTENNQKFQPGHDKPHPETLAEHSVEGKPTKTYFHGSDRPEQEEPMENEVTGPDAVTKYPDNVKPADSETTVHGIQFPERVTDKSENVNHSDETGTEYPDTNTGEPIKESMYSEEFRPTAEYPQSSIKYSPRPKPGTGNVFYSTERTETVSTIEDQSGSTKYSYESSTTKRTQLPELVATTLFGLPDDSSEYPFGFKPDSENYPENSGIGSKPQGSTNYPLKKPSLEDESYTNQYPYERDQLESSTKFPDGEKPESIETFGMVITEKPEKSKYPDGSKYSEITTPDDKYSQETKPTLSHDILYGTAYPKRNDSKDDVGITETPEYLGQHPSAQYPQRPKPSGEKLSGNENSDEVTSQPEGTSLSPGINKSPVKNFSTSKLESEDAPYGEEHSEGTDFTEKPDYESKYSDKTGYLTNRPFLGRPKPTDRPYGTEYPESNESDVSGQMYSSTRYPEVVEEQEVTEHSSEMEETGTPEKSPVLHSQDSKKPQETASPDVSGTEEYPNENKPMDEYPKPSEKPHIPIKYPARPKPSASDGDIHGAGYSEITEKPKDEQLSTQYPQETEITVRPEDDKYSENIKITGKPHGIHRYPLRPKPTGLEDEPFGNEYSETTEKLDEASTVQGQDAFDKNPIKLKPVTKHPEESYETGKPKDPEKTEPEDDQFFSTEFPEEKKPEENKPSKYPITSHQPESISENTPYGTEYPSSATAQPDIENKHPEVFKPTEKQPAESGVTEKPYNSIKYPESHTEGEEKPYSTEYPEVTEAIKHPEGSESQEPEDKIISTELFGVTRKPVSPSGDSTDEISTKFSAPIPGIAYLPQGGELPNEKVPSNEHLYENSKPVVSEHSSTTEKTAASSPAEGNLVSTLHPFENNQDKPSSLDLTHELGSSSPSQDLITKYSDHTTTPSHLHERDQFSTKPTDETKPTEFEINAPVSADDYPGRPKPIIPSEELHKVQDPHTGFVETSVFPSKISEMKRPEVTSDSETAGTKKPDDAHQLSETESTQYPGQYFSTVKPGTHESPDSQNNMTNDMKHPEGVSTVKFGNDYTTPGKHMTSTLKQPSDGNLETTDHSATEKTHLEEAFSTESVTEHMTYENYPERASLPAEGFTGRPAQDLESFAESTTYTSQDGYLPEKISTGAFTKVQKTTTPSDNDLINKLHDIISGIQSQVTEGKITKQPYGGYESTSYFGLPTEVPQDYYEVTDKFGKPAQKPQDLAKLPHGQIPESSSTPSRHPIDDVFSSENEVYGQTTTDLEATEIQTNRPQFSYTSESGSTEHSVFATSKGPEGIRPTEIGDSFSTKRPYQETPSRFPATTVSKPESTEFQEAEKLHNIKHPEVPTKDGVTSFPDQSSPTSRYPTDDSPIFGKPKPEGSVLAELPDRPAKPENKYPEESTVFSPKPSGPDSTSFSEYSENISTTPSSFVSVEDSGKPDSQEGNSVITETPVKIGSTTSKYPYNQDRTTQIYEEVKGNQVPIESMNNMIAENNKTAPQNENLLHETVPQGINQKHPISVSTDKPLHVVYPTYYPEGIVTRIPGSKPDGETDKKVTVTPQTIVPEGTTIKSTEFSSPSASKFGETHTVYEEHTESSTEFSATSPVVIIQEVHTEVHSERSPTKNTEGYIQQTTTPMYDDKVEIIKGKPHDHKPEYGFEKFTEQPELTSQSPQIIFGQPAVTRPTGDQLTLEKQTSQPLDHDQQENEKFSTLSTHAQYPAKQPESSTKPEFVTVTPIGTVPVTKDFDNIMHLYSSKYKPSTTVSSIQQPESFTTASFVYPESVKHTTEKGETADLIETQTNFVTDQGIGRPETTHTPDILGTFIPFRKTTQKPTEGRPGFQENATVPPTQEIEEEYEMPHVLHPGAAKQPSFDILTEGLFTQDKTSEFTTTEGGITQRPQGISFVPYKLINGNKVYYPEKESPERPTPELSPFDGYDRIPYEIVNGTKFFYPNRVVTSQPEALQSTTTATPMGMYVPYKIVNGSKIYYTQDKPQKPEKFDGLDYVPFDIINGTKIFYTERVTTTPPPSLAMYVPFKMIDGTKVYYAKEAQEEPQNIPDEYDGFDYIPYSIVNGNKIFHPEHIPGHVPTTTEQLPAMYVPYKLLNGNKVYYPKDAQTKPESVPEGYDGFDLVPYEIVNGTKLFHPDPTKTQAPEQVTDKTSAMFVPYKVINGTKVYFPKYAQSKPTHTPEGYDGFDYLPFEVVNGTKVFRPERVTPKPEFTSTPAFYSSGMFVPYKVINNTKVFFPKDAQYKPRPLKPGYDGVQYLLYDVINGTKVFYPERVTTPTPIVQSAMYVPYKIINGTKVYYADKATENPEKIPEEYEGFDYVPYEIVNGNKLFYPNRLTSTMGMYVPYKKVNGSKVYYPKDSSEKRQPVPEGYDGADYVPYEVINETKVFYPDRFTTSQPTPTMYVPYKMVNGMKVYYPKNAQHEPFKVIEGYDGFDSLPYEIVNGTNVFHPEDITQRPTPAYPQGMFVPYKMVNGTKVYYPQEAHKRPHPLSDEYSGLDYIPYEVVNGTKVFHPERLTPSAVLAMYVPYKLINGTKVYYPKHAQHKPQQILSEYDGFDYVPYEVINGSQVFYPNRISNYQGMYVPYKIINGEKVFYPEYAQHKPLEVLEGYDGFDYLPYESLNSTNIIKPTGMITEAPFEQAMYVPYKVVNGTKIFYAESAQYKPYLIPQGFDGFDYIPYEIVNGTKVFDPDLMATPGTSYKPAMYVPFKIIDGKKVYYSQHAQSKPQLVPEGFDGFDYIPYEVVNGTKIFDPEQAVPPSSVFKPSLYVPYKIMNGIKIYQPKHAQHKPSHLPQDYEGFDYLPYDVVNGNKVFYPEQSVPLKQAMYVPFKYVNGTKVFYPKYAQYVPMETGENYDGFEYIPYEIVKGNKVFHPEQAVTTETPVRKAMYVPYKVVNGTKVYYPKYAHYNQHLIPQGYDGFDYIPYEVIDGNKVFHPEQAITPETSFKQAMYVPFRVVNGTKVYYPKHAQLKPQLIPENYDGFDYLPYRIVNGTKIFDPQASSRPTYLQGMYVPYKSVNNTKVFYPKDAHNKPNYIPEGYDGADYVPYEPLNNTKMFYPELISTAQPDRHGSAGVYVPFKVVNNKKIFYPKEATPFPPTVRYPYDGVAFVPYKMLGETSPSEIIYVDDNESFKPHKPSLESGYVPGEGSCYINNKTFANNTEIPPVSPCQASCVCISSVVRCVRVKCPSSPENKLDCSPVYKEGSCCPTYVCGDLDYEYSITTGYPETKVPEFVGNGSSGQDVDATTPFFGYEVQKRPSYESGNLAGQRRPEVQTPSEEYHLHKPPKPKPEHESLEPYDSVEGQLTPDEDYDVEDEEPYGPGTCRYAGKVYVSAQQIPRDDPCDFCFCFRSDIICLQQSCPPPIPGCRDEPIQGFCCPRYECHVKMATMVNVTSTTTTTTTTTLPPHFFPHAFKGSVTKTGCFVQGRAYGVGQAIPSASGPCMDCICGGNGRMKCDPKVCTPEPMIRKMINPSEDVTSPSNER